MVLERLKNHIEENGLKKKKVAQNLGISVGHLSYILNGRRDISIEIENKIRKLLK